MANSANGVAYLDKARASVINGDAIDWERWLNTEDKARIIPAESLAAQAKAEMLLGAPGEEGLRLPWHKTADKVLLRPGKLSIWTGWSRHGKTQMLKQAMLCGVRETERVLIVSLEEEVIEIWKDLAQIACHTRDPSPREIDQFAKFIGGSLWLYDQQGQINPQKAVALLRYAASELHITHFVIDSLMMLKVGRDDYEAQAAFVSSLKTAAKDTHCHVHLVAHMRKREGKTGEETPGTLHDIAGGHELGSIADNVFCVWRDRNYKEKNDPTKPECVLGVEKQRGRVNWTGNVGLACHQPSRQFIEASAPIHFWPSVEDQASAYKRAASGE